MNNNQLKITNIKSNNTLGEKKNMNQPKNIEKKNMNIPMSRFQNMQNMQNFKIPIVNKPLMNKNNNSNRYMNNVNAFNTIDIERPLSDILQFFFQLMVSIKTYHWQTTSYSRHKATDKMLESLMEHIDRFVEVYQGKYKRLNILEGKNDEVYIRNRNDVDMEEYIQECILFLEKDLVEYRYIRETDTDLLNIRDEIVGDLNQLLYLFSLQ